MRKLTKEIFDNICVKYGAKFTSNLKNPVLINKKETTIFCLCKDEIYRCIIDTEDLKKVCFGGTWIIHKRKDSDILRVTNGKKYIYTLILESEKGKVIDHINRDGLDNRKANLRIVNQGQNMLNKKTYKNCKVSNLLMRKGENYELHFRRMFKSLEIAEKARDEIIKIANHYSEIDAKLRDY